MDTQGAFCVNESCPARGKAGAGNIKVHCHKTRRYRCTTCGKTFAATKGTPLYRCHKDHGLFVCVVTLLAYGCPTQAVVRAFGLDERTVADWQAKAGEHAQKVQEHFLRTQPLDLQHVQADEVYGHTVGGRCWLAMALAVPHRLWLGGVLSPARDLSLIQHLANLVRLAWLPGKALLLCVDGLCSYPTAFFRAFREKLYRGCRGRPPFRLPGCVWLAQVVKRHAGRRLTGVVRRVLWGSAEQVAGQLSRTEGGQQINTSYIERINATFRSRLAALGRRTRARLRQAEVLHRGMYLVGVVYNFCTTHRSLRLRQDHGPRWLQRTPATAAGWTDHTWSTRQLLLFRTPPTLHG